MMTVLLLVYVLLSLLFGMSIKEDTESKYESLMAKKAYNDLQNQIYGDDVERKVKFEEQLVDDNVDENKDMLTAREGDLIITLAPGQTKFKNDEVIMFRNWYNKNKDEINKKGIYLGFVINQGMDVSLGAAYHRKHVLYLESLKILSKLNPDLKPSDVTQKNPKAVEQILKEYIIFRVAK
nr:hypothetical protein EATA8330_44710 [Enterobacter asburiae]